MGLAALLFGGGLLFWVGLWSGQRVLQLGGRSLLVVPFVAMMASGSIASVMLPVLAGVITLAGRSKPIVAPHSSVGSLRGWVIFSSSWPWDSVSFRGWRLFLCSRSVTAVSRFLQKNSC